MNFHRHYKYYKYLGVSLIVFSLLSGCGGQLPSADEVTPQTGVLLPGQVNSSQLNQVVKVRGQVVQVIQNPGGQGGLYIKLTGGGGEVGVRIESETWETMSPIDKAQFKQGKTATVEGTLVKPGDDLVIVLGVTSPGPPSPTPPPAEESEKTIFIVKVPSNTPSYSTIYMEWYYREGGYWSNVENMFKMKRLSADTWKVDVALSPTDYGADGKYFYYRYSRDKWGYPAAEEFTPDAEDACRQIDIAESTGNTINDEVKKWRWFPSSDEPPIPVPPSSAQTAVIVPRIQGQKLLRGFGLMDFWNESYGIPLDEPTLQAIKADSANCISLGGPVWTYRQIDPLPVIKESAFYPLEGLESQLKLYKENGFHVVMNLQFGTFAEDPSFYQGNPFETEHSQEWWDAWYQEVEKAMLISADLAEKYKIEMMAPCGGLLTAWGKAPDEEKRFAEIIDKVRQHYSGKIGASQVLGFKPPDWSIPLPTTSEIPAYKKYDFINLVLVPALTTSSNPTQEELNAAAKKLFDSRIKPLYDQYRKPVLLIPQYASYKGVLQDTGKYSEAETSLWLPYNPNVIFDSAEQAMAYEAIMNAVAGAEYVIGVEAFAYLLEDFPQSTEVNVRGKPAERFIANWYQRFAQEGE